MQQNNQTEQLRKSSILLDLYSNKLTSNLNLVAAFHRAFAIFLCMFYYTYVEKIPLELRLLQNDWTLIYFVLYAQYLSCFLLQLGPIYWKKLGSESRLEYYMRVGYVAIGYLNIVLIGCVLVVWPVLCWFNFKITQVDTDYFSLRYLFYIFYIAIQIIPYRAIDNMQMFFGDGIFLT